MFAQQNEALQTLPDSISPMLPVMVVLGNPKNPDCSQHGICRIYEAGNAHEACTCQHQTFAWLSFTYLDTISLRFLENFVRPDSIGEFFKADYFLIQHAYNLPDALLRKLQCPKKELVLHPGVYPIRHYPEYLEVQFG